MSIWTNFDPASGPTRLLIAFEVIVLGGLGSLWGSLAGGIVLGVAQAIGGQFDIAWQMMAGHIVFLIVLALRPQGLFPKYDHEFDAQLVLNSRARLPSRS